MILLKNGDKTDSAFKKDIDFEEMRLIAADNAAKDWDKVNNVISTYPTAESWVNVRDNIMKGDLTGAKNYYHAQPQVKAFKTVKDGFFDSLGDYKVSREEYINAAINNSFSTFAAIKESKWYSKGKMGWFGMSDDEMTDNEWNSQLRQMIDELPDNTLISIYDCHI